MQLKPKKINIKTGKRNIALLHADTAAKLDIMPGDRVQLVSERSKIIAMIDTQKNGFPKKSIGLFSNAYEELNIEKNDLVAIKPAEKPKSILYIKKKLDGGKLTAEEYDEIIHDIVEDRLTEIETTYFVAGIYTNNTDDEETASLIHAMLKHGKILDFGNKIVADKHCIGGVPGNRVTPLVVSIMVASGVLMPKTSSRAITSPAGTADTVESVANVALTASQLKKVVQKAGGFMAWGGGVQLAPADDIIIRVETPLSLDPEGMLLASIMSKKASVSANHVIIDIPVGKTAKVKTMERAKHLKKRFEGVGKKLGMKMAVIITDGSQPIGNGIGPMLEMIDVMKVLQNSKDAPKDLRDKALMECGILLELCGKTRKGEGLRKATEILQSGKAWKTFNKILYAQGKKKPVKLGKFTFDVPALKSGAVKEIHNKRLTHVARMAGTPKDKGAGLFLHKKAGDRVEKGGILYTIYTNSPDRLKYAMEFIKEHPVYILKS